MSGQKQHAPRQSEGHSVAPRRGLLFAGMVLALVAAGVVYWWFRHHSADGSASTGDAVQEMPARAETPLASSLGDSVKPVLQPLLGRWQRPDGEYVIEISAIDPNGDARVAYFNPRPIHVSRAKAVHDSQGAKLFIELRDVGYPGCIYRLIYDRPTDQLVGTYYQAAMQETFDVVFARQKRQ